MTLLTLACLALPALQEEDALDAFQKAWREAPDDDARILAVEALGRSPSVKAVARLAPILASGSGRVRGAAAKALGGFAEHRRPAAVALLNGIAANPKDTPVLDAVFQALVRLQEPGSAAGLARFFDDKDLPTARGAVAAAGKLGHPGVVDGLIAVLGRTEKLLKPASDDAVEVTDPNTGATVTARPDAERRARAKVLHEAAVQSLREITGATHPSSEAWAAWWAQNRSKYPPPK